VHDYWLHCVRHKTKSTDASNASLERLLGSFQPLPICRETVES
jgi:hypothetical protein